MKNSPIHSLLIGFYDQKKEPLKRFSSSLKGLDNVSSSHANTQRPVGPEKGRDKKVESEENVDTELRFNLSHLVAKLAVEIEQMHDEQVQLQHRECGCGTGKGKEESDDTEGSSNASARQRSLNAILDLIRNIKESLGRGDSCPTVDDDQQVVLFGLYLKE